MPEFTLASSFSTPAGPTDGAIVYAYKASRFASPPAVDTTLLASPDAGPVTTGVSFGGPGAVQIAVPTNEDYYLAFSYNGHIYWQYVGNPSFNNTDGKTTTLFGTIDAQLNPVVNVPDPVNNHDAVNLESLIAYGAANPGPVGPSDLVINDTGIPPSNHNMLWLDETATGSGTTGACGVSGTPGACGVSGAGGSGACGVSGTSGACGVSGAAGACGVSGVAGACGVSGTTGGAGSAGACGVSGTTGACGVSGTTGAAGACGVSGTAGAAGAC